MQLEAKQAYYAHIWKKVSLKSLLKWLFVEQEDLGLIQAFFQLPFLSTQLYFKGVGKKLENLLIFSPVPKSIDDTSSVRKPSPADLKTTFFKSGPKFILKNWSSVVTLS